MLDIQIKYLIELQIWKCISILFIYANLGNAEDGSKYLELTKNTGTFKLALSHGFHPGGLITVNGTVNPNANRFFINLEDRSGSKVYLHVNPRFDEKLIVFSNKINDDWRPGYDQTAINLTSLSRGGQFEISLICNVTGYMIQFNQELRYLFNHRFDTSIIRNIKFSGDTTINSVLYIPGDASCALEGCHANAQCVSDDDTPYYCKCDSGYSGPLCQVSCEHVGCTGNNVCLINNGKHTCRSRTDLAGDPSSSSSVMCRDPYVAVGTECIWVDLTRLNWDAARFKCQENGGFLLEPDFPVNFKQYMSTHYPENENTGFWVGGADRGLHRWVWVTSLMDIQDDFPWGENEPNDLEWNTIKEDCMSLYTHSGKSYFYNDAHCNTDVYYICESHPLIPPTAAALVDDSAAVALDHGSLDLLLQMQVAILLMLVMAMVIVTGALIYKNTHIFKKAYSSFGDHSMSFRNQDAGKLHEEDDIQHF